PRELGARARRLEPRRDLVEVAANRDRARERLAQARPRRARVEPLPRTVEARADGLAQASLAVLEVAKDLLQERDDQLARLGRRRGAQVGDEGGDRDVDLVAARRHARRAARRDRARDDLLAE